MRYCCCNSVESEYRQVCFLKQWRNCDFHRRIKNTSAKSKARGWSRSFPRRHVSRSVTCVVFVMVNKCVMGCASRQQQQQDDEKPSIVRNFHFPIKRNMHLLSHWERYYKPKGRPPFSAAMIRFALHLRHTSAQAYRLLLEKFPLPSFSLLNKIQKGGVDAVKGIKLLREKGKMSKDVVLMVDEMFLQKIVSFKGIC